MLEILPFRAIRFSEKAGNATNLVAPPYDVISPEMQRALYNASDYNAVRLELPIEENRYEIARTRLRSWLHDGILKQDENDAIFPCYQTFKVPNTDRVLTRSGIIVRCRLYDFKDGIVLPHEKTLPKAKADRLSLFKTTEANLSPIFGIYDDIAKEADNLVSEFVRNNQPFMHIKEDYQSTQNKIWKISDKNIIQQITRSFKNKKIYIADGHHRYETAIAYRNLCKEQNPTFSHNHNANFIMIYLANMRDEGMVALPTHRIIHSIQNFSQETLLEKLNEKFVTTRISSKTEMNRLMQISGKFAFGMILKDSLFILTLKENANIKQPNMSHALSELNLTVLHKIILEDILGISEKKQAEQTNIIYSKVADDIFNIIENKTDNAQVAFLVNPITIDEMIQICESGDVMPQKSTFFFPKILTGIAFYSLANT